MATTTLHERPHVSIDLDAERVKGWLDGAKDGAEKIRQLRALFAVSRRLATDNAELITMEPADFTNFLDLVDGQLNDIEHEMDDAIAFMSMLEPNDATKGRGTRPTLKVIPSRKSKEG